ncbi:unannotated protein [freshwater metagenome]|uniref:Unannotated protein n=1 Tax=freshwater metagenome TaxID=449393 RepID=A0A6J6HHA1_9ZZZZ
MVATGSASAGSTLLAFLIVGSVASIRLKAAGVSAMTRTLVIGPDAPSTVDKPEAASFSGVSKTRLGSKAQRANPEFSPIV